MTFVGGDVYAFAKETESKGSVSKVETPVKPELPKKEEVQVKKPVKK